MKRARVVNRYPQFADDVQRRAAGVMTLVLNRGGTELGTLVPVDLGNLLNSQYKDVQVERGAVHGRIGFTAEYAAAVHAAEGKLKGQPRPKRDGKDRGRYWGPHEGQPRFLALAFERAASDIKSILRGALRVGKAKP